MLILSISFSFMCMCGLWTVDCRLSNGGEREGKIEYQRSKGKWQNLGPWLFQWQNSQMKEDAWPAKKLETLRPLLHKPFLWFHPFSGPSFLAYTMLSNQPIHIGSSLYIVVSWVIFILVFYLGMCWIKGMVKHDMVVTSSPQFPKKILSKKWMDCGVWLLNTIHAKFMWEALCFMQISFHLGCFHKEVTLERIFMPIFTSKLDLTL